MAHVSRLRPGANRPGLISVAAVALFLSSPLSEVAAQQSDTVPYTIPDIRNGRFCEFLLIKEGNVDIYNTTGMNECPAELWDALDLEDLAREHGAEMAQKNGPKYWMMDEQTIGVGQTKSFGGIEARWVARIPASFLSGDKGTSAYKPFTTKKTQRMVYAKGKKVFELLDADGKAYVLQAREHEFPIDTLDDLGAELNLADGWSYRSRILEEDLVLDLTPDLAIHAVGDDAHQYYTLPPEAD